MSNHASNGEESTNQAQGARNEPPDLRILRNEIRRMMQQELGPIIQESINRAMPPPMGNLPRRAQPQADDEEVQSSNYYSRGSRHSNRDQRRPRRERGRLEDQLGGLKLKIPPFHGKNDPDAYLEWEKKIELVFDCQNLSELRKVQVAATEFCDYAINWWDQIVTSRRRNRDPPVDTWDELKNLLRKRFVPNHYHRELHQKLRRLS